jgi:hypothetical protein
MSQPTFRDFAGSIMSGDVVGSAKVLEVLLGLDDSAARDAATFFQTQMGKDPNFVMKSMGLRAAVTSGSDDEIATLVRECFGVGGDALEHAVTTLKRLYPR